MNKISKIVGSLFVGLTMIAGSFAFASKSNVTAVEAATKNPIIIDSTYLNLTENKTAETTFTATDALTYVGAPKGSSTKIAPTNLGTTHKNCFSTNKPIIIGKSGAYLYNTAAMPYDILGIDIYTNQGASTSVQVLVGFGASAMSTAISGTTTTLNAIDTVFNFPCSTTGNKYFRFQIASAHNAQVQIRVYFEISNVPVTGVTLDATTATLDQGTSKQLTETVAPDNATNKKVSWSSSAPAVASVSDKGLVEALTAGEAIITVTTEDGSKTATCTVTVNASLQMTFELINSTTSLVPGAKYIIVGANNDSYFAMKKYESGNNIKPIAVPAPVSGKITGYESVLSNCVYTLGGEADAYTLFDGAKYIYAAGGTSASNNYLKSKETVDDTAKWTISFDGNTATIVANDENTTNKTMRYNTASALFSCYSGLDKQSDVYLYKFVPAQPTEHTAENFATYFLDVTGGICNPVTNNLTALKAVWPGLKTEYNNLDSTEKAKVSGKTTSNIEAAVNRYEYICGKYNAGGVELEEFIEGIVITYSIIIPQTLRSETNSTSVIVIVTIAMASVTGLGVLLALKRRKGLVK